MSSKQTDHETDKNPGSAEEVVDETSDEAAPETDHGPDLYDCIKDIWICDQEVRIYRDVLRREGKKSLYPDREDLEAMEEPIHRLQGAAALFTDLAMGNGCEVNLTGLSFLAEAVTREAERLYRLYHGHLHRDRR